MPTKYKFSDTHVKYSIPKESEELVDLIVFSIDRKKIGKIDFKTKVKISPELDIPKQSDDINGNELLVTFELSRIVGLPGPGHYTSYFKCGEEWYYYNDMAANRYERKGGIPKIKAPQTILDNKVGFDVQTHGTLFFYRKKKIA